MIGRAAELAELEAALTDAASGRPSLVFVAGESGVGKTRILDEAARRARAAGGRLLSGDCVELGEGELPYAPIVAALRPLARDGDPALDALPDSARIELMRLLPGLGVPGPAPASEDVGAAQGRLFEALLLLLEQLGSEHAVVLMIEDLHWADRSTRNFLTFLARTLCRERAAETLEQQRNIAGELRFGLQTHHQGRGEARCRNTASGASRSLPVRRGR